MIAPDYNTERRHEFVRWLNNPDAPQEVEEDSSPLPAFLALAVFCAGVWLGIALWGKP